MIQHHDKKLLSRKKAEHVPTSAAYVPRLHCYQHIGPRSLTMIQGCDKRCPWAEELHKLAIRGKKQCRGNLYEPYNVPVTLWFGLLFTSVLVAFLIFEMWQFLFFFFFSKICLCDAQIAYMYFQNA